MKDRWVGVHGRKKMSKMIDRLDWKRGNGKETHAHLSPQKAFGNNGLRKLQNKFKFGEKNRERKPFPVTTNFFYCNWIVTIVCRSSHYIHLLLLSLPPSCPRVFLISSFAGIDLMQKMADSLIFLLIIWPAPRASKMSQILRCDWLPERARWNYLARSGLPIARSLGI